MKNIYYISGLGADERIFAKLKIEGCRLVHIPWPHHEQTDNMASYAEKVSQLIPETDPIILGVSFGGMLATEIAKFRRTRKTIIISSAKNFREKPPMPYTVKRLICSGIIPAKLYEIPNPVVYRLFGVESDEDREVLRKIILDTDGKLAKLSMECIAKWENEVVPEHIIHIHGRNDKLIIPDSIFANYWVEDGGHMMIYNRAELVSSFIQKEIETL